MKNNMVVLLLILTSIHQIYAQKQFMDEQEEENGFRIIGIIGHTLVNNKGLNNVMVPSWGLDVEYWFNEQWGIGFHNDIEIETFIIKNSKNEEVERVNPFVFTLDMLYHFGNGFVLTLGPGVEIEKEESYYLGRVGVEYEKDINKSFYILPNIFLDQRFDGYNTWNVGLGIGMRL